MCNKFKKYFSVLFFSTMFLAYANVQADGAVATQMVPVTYQEWETQRKKYLPKIVVVDMWAMWCHSCIERFPEMVNMHEKYQQDIQFVSLNLDDREDTQSLEIADKFLMKMNADFDHYRMDENLLQAFEKLDLISIPAVLIYDEHGNEKFRLTGDNPNKQFTEKNIEDAIISLLAKKEN